MSKQKRGMFRRMVDTIRRSVGLSVHYPDPVLRDSRGIPQRKKKRAHGHVSRGRFRRTRELSLKAPPCIPGTITYHDKLVRHFGRRKAEGYGMAIQLGHLSCLPSAQDFADNLPWAFLK